MNYFSNILYYIHIFIIVLLILLPLYPIKILQYIFIAPLILPLFWFIFDGCPLSNYHDKGMGTMDLIKLILTNLNFEKNTIENRSIYLHYFILMLIFFLSMVRLFIHYCDVKLITIY